MLASAHRRDIGHPAIIWRATEMPESFSSHPPCAMFDPMNSSVIVWDLETVPDLRGFALVNDLVSKTDEEVRAVLGNKFPKHIYHSIVCIGALVAHRERDHWAVDALGAPHVGERTEKQLDRCILSTGSPS